MWAFVALVISLVPTPGSAQWVDCAFNNELDSATSLAVEVKCTTIQVPLDHTAPTGAKIPHHITRVRPRRLLNLFSTSVTQVWILSGGPGYPGNDLGRDIRGLLFLDQGFEFYLPDHRGTGYSNELSCINRNYDQFSQDCLQYGIANRDFLKHFTVSNAARDLKVAIDQYRRSTVPVVLHGISYGTMLAQRYLQLYPSTVTAVVLDSPLDPTTYSVALLDQQDHEVFGRVLASCQRSSTCNEIWTRNSEQVAASVLRMMQQWKTLSLECIKTNFPQYNTNHHANTWLGLAHTLFGDVTYHYQRAHYVASWSRLRSCQPEDRQILSKYFKIFGMDQVVANPVITAPPVNRSFVKALQSNILLSDELLPLPGSATIPTAASVRAAADTLLTVGKFPADLLLLRERGWPAYPADQYSRKYVTGGTEKVLVFGGEYDSATPLPMAQRISAARPDWLFLTTPLGSHVQLKYECSLQVILNFWTNPNVTDPTQSVSCWSQLKAKESDFDWNSTWPETKAATLQLFGSNTQLFPLKGDCTEITQDLGKCQVSFGYGVVKGRCTALSGCVSPIGVTTFSTLAACTAKCVNVGKSTPSPSDKQPSPASPKSATNTDETDDENEPSAPSTNDEGSLSSGGIAIIIIVAILMLLMIIALLAFARKRRQRPRYPTDGRPPPGSPGYYPPPKTLPADNRAPTVYAPAEMEAMDRGAYGDYAMGYGSPTDHYQPYQPGGYGADYGYGAPYETYDFY